MKKEVKHIPKANPINIVLKQAHKY